MIGFAPAARLNPPQSPLSGMGLVLIEPVEQDIPVNDRLIEAVQHGTIEQVRQLLQEGANPDALSSDNGEPALLLAILREPVDLSTLMIQALLEAEADPLVWCLSQEQSLVSLLWVAVIERLPHAVSLLLKNGLDANTLYKEDTMLDLAAKYADGPTLKAFFDAGVKLDKVNGLDALARAAYYGNRETVELLVTCGVDVNSAASHGDLFMGKTPLMCAAASSNDSSLSIMEYLISKGADIKATTDNAWNCMTFAIKSEQAGKKISFLIKNGVKVKARDCMMAIDSNKLSVLTSLFEDPDLSPDTMYAGYSLLGASLGFRGC